MKDQVAPHPIAATAATSNPSSLVEVRHLTQNELSRRLGVSEPTLERWRSIGIGPIFLKLAGRVRYRLSDVVTYEESCLRASTSCRVQAVPGARQTEQQS